MFSRFPLATAARIGAALLLSAALAACSPSANTYTTELDTTGGLTAGSAVTHGGTTIGSVTGTSSKINGDYDVDFDVQNDFAGAVHHDSIAVLHTDTGAPTIDIYNTDPNSPPADPGAKITGVSSQRELAALLASKSISSFATGLSGMMGAMSTAPPAGSVSPGAAVSPGTAGSSGASGGPTTPPVSAQSALDQFQKDLSTIQNQTANAGPATAASAAQLNSITQQTQQIENQLIQQGNSAQANQLRDALNKLTQTLANPPTPAAPALPAAPTP